MGNNTFINTVLTFAVIAALTSCKKYLDIKSDKSQTVPETLTDLQGILDDNIYMNKRTPGFGQSSDDDYFVLESTYNTFGIIDQQVYKWNLRDYNYASGDWGLCYTSVYNANYCLEQIEKIEKTPMNESEWNNVKGSALFFRGFTFLNLIWEYGKAYDESTSNNDLGIVLRLGADFNAPSVRASVKESYEQIIRDLNQAISLLPNTPLHVMRPSKAASYALLARAYLSMRNYDSVLKYTNLTLEIKNNFLDYNSSQVRPTRTNPFRPFNAEIIFYSTQTNNYTPKFFDYASIDTLLYNTYSDDDMRKIVFFEEYHPGYKSFKGHYSADLYTFFSGIATDEVYLMRAEANARLDNLTDAMNDLNALLAKRYITGTFMPITAIDKEDAINIILLERRKELTQRGLRWIDIKRLNKEGANITPKRLIGGQTFILSPNDNKFALPLPSDLLKLTGMQQN